MKNLFFLNLNHLIARDFWMVKIWPYFSWVHMNYNFLFKFFFQVFCPKKYCLKVLDGALFLWNLWVFFLGLSNFLNDISYIKYKFSHKFGKVCRWLNMYYSKIRIIIFSKVTTMSIWFILNNFVWTCRECNFCQYWAIVTYIYP
jgi:hypothetical protein